MNNDLIHYGIGTAFVAVVAASAILGLSQISIATQSNAETPAVETATLAVESAPAAAKRTIRVILPSPYSSL